MKLDEIKLDVFDVGGPNSPDVDIAFASLRVALRAYFSSYAALAGSLRVLEDSTSKQEDIDFQFGWRYSEAAAETIVHFQHFAELVCKHFLRKDHALLVDTPVKDPVVLHKLLHGDALTTQEEQPLSSSEFSQALVVLKKLVDAGALKDSATLHWLKGHVPALELLNTLRNRIWHRGKYVLRYQALDCFIGANILPFVRDVISTPDYSGQEFRWAPSTPSCNLDLVDEVIKAASSAKPDLRKLAFLKATGAAAYQSPLRGAKPTKNRKLASFGDMLDGETRQRAEAKAAAVAELEHQSVIECHVCGVLAMVLFTEVDNNYDEGPEEDWQRWEYSHQVNCECCGFTATTEIGNPSQHGFPQIKDLWFTKTF